MVSYPAKAVFQAGFALGRPPPKIFTIGFYYRFQKTIPFVTKFGLQKTIPFVEKKSIIKIPPKKPFFCKIKLSSDVTLVTNIFYNLPSDIPLVTNTFTNYQVPYHLLQII